MPPFERLPDILLLQILEKMSLSSLLRCLRSTKWLHYWIEENATRLRFSPNWNDLRLVKIAGKIIIRPLNGEHKQLEIELSPPQVARLRLDADLRVIEGVEAEDVPFIIALYNSAKLTGVNFYRVDPQIVHAVLEGIRPPRYVTLGARSNFDGLYQPGLLHARAFQSVRSLTLNSCYWMQYLGMVPLLKRLCIAGALNGEVTGLLQNFHSRECPLPTYIEIRMYQWREQEMWKILKGLSYTQLKDDRTDRKFLYSLPLPDKSVLGIGLGMDRHNASRTFWVICLKAFPSLRDINAAFDLHGIWLTEKKLE